ncbi:uncharacterized protein RJT20DRAFT_42321 [Scheffersomyces xylosifermentans]|uniref:uncharacterized protein n=1 Tax=Scheffersomyces xylosifermentans TaxID=1304137 RepID=UPI00315CC2DC
MVVPTSFLYLATGLAAISGGLAHLACACEKCQAENGVVTGAAAVDSFAVYSRILGPKVRIEHREARERDSCMLEMRNRGCSTGMIGLLTSSWRRNITMKGEKFGGSTKNSCANSGAARTCGARVTRYGTSQNGWKSNGIQRYTTGYEGLGQKRIPCGIGGTILHGIRWKV